MTITIQSDHSTSMSGSRDVPFLANEMHNAPEIQWIFLELLTQVSTIKAICTSSDTISIGCSNLSIKARSVSNDYPIPSSRFRTDEPWSTLFCLPSLPLPLWVLQNYITIASTYACCLPTCQLSRNPFVFNQKINVLKDTKVKILNCQWEETII